MPCRLTSLLEAADLMKMRVLQVLTDEQREVARQLQPGRVFENGRAFTPFREVFSVMTAGVIALGQERQLQILEAVAKFDSFDGPLAEHEIWGA